MPTKSLEQLIAKYEPTPAGRTKWAGLLEDMIQHGIYAGVDAKDWVAAEAKVGEMLLNCMWNMDRQDAQGTADACVELVTHLITGLREER